MWSNNDPASILSPTPMRYWDHAAKNDRDFIWWWNSLTADRQIRSLRILEELHQIGVTLPSDESASTDTISFRKFLDMQARTCMSCLPNKDFEYQPDDRFWMKLAADIPRNEILWQQAVTRIARLLGHWYDEPVAIYGNRKAVDAVERKISAHQKGHQPLDLWDLARVRIVAQTLSGVAAIATILRCECETEIARTRNYYTHPRTPESLYRALHMILCSGGGFVEVQIMTASREVVCELDHAAFFKRSLALMDSEHLEWLKQISIAANLRDVTNGYWPPVAVAVDPHECRHI